MRVLRTAVIAAPGSKGTHRHSPGHEPAKDTRTEAAGSLQTWVMSRKLTTDGSAAGAHHRPAMTSWLGAGLHLLRKVDTEIRAGDGSEVTHGKGPDAASSHIHSAVQKRRRAFGDRGGQAPQRGRHEPGNRTQPAAALEGASELEA